MISPEELRTLEHRRLASLREADLVLAHELHADEYQLINPYGQTINKMTTSPALLRARSGTTRSSRSLRSKFG
jgi:hypothetical protein